jgi:hypothetical protein
MIEAAGAWHIRNMSFRPSLRTVLACCTLILAAACAQDPDQPDPDPELESLEASANIPVEGGSIELSDGARVEFPAGALTEEAEVTLRRIGCGGIYESASFGSCRYAVEGPSELLAGPYQLSLPTRSPARASQQTVDGLMPLYGGQSSEGSVTTLVHAFSEFTSWSDDLVVPANACVMPDFEPCGGDVMGNWTMTDACGTVNQLTNSSWSGPNPYESCEPLDYYTGYPFSISGTLEFAEGSYETSGGYTILQHGLVTADCLASSELTCLPDLCTMVDGICECLFVMAESDGNGGGDVWSVADGVLMMGSAQHRYCVEGDTLTIEWAGDSPYYKVYTRQ